MTTSSRPGQRKGTGILLHPAHYRLTLAILTIVALSGLVYCGVRDVAQVEDWPWSHPLLQAHGAFSFLSLILLGSLLPQHIRFAWNARRNLVTGLIALGTMAILAISAYGLYYAPEEWHLLMKWTHIAIGVALVAAIPLHIVVGRTRRAHGHAHGVPRGPGGASAGRQPNAGNKQAAHAETVEG
ncbi:hypothetical protein [Burkholderia ubonensis]|uniref:hypothetical protein n=1 Tax=Burkholderia ubonensis TaxID=101571 RepID=UPI0007C6D31E|nr:hypothetical protein [Burkholderia ubonensis]